MDQAHCCFIKLFFYGRIIVVDNTPDLAQILQGLSYKACLILLSNFFSFRSLILVVGISAIIHKIACCYAVGTFEICL